MSTNTKKIEVDAPKAKETFERWLKRGDAIGVFSNHDLSSRDCGRKIFLPIMPEEQEQGLVKIGKTSAPDSPTYGTGWKYLLDEIVTDISRFEFKE